MTHFHQKRGLRSFFGCILALALCVSGPSFASEGDAAVLAGYKKGFYIKSADDRFKMAIGQRVQIRFAHEEIEDGDNENAFSIPRARLGMKGHAFNKDITYKFQMDLGKGNVALKDFFVDHALMPGTLHIRAGQWKRPFSRQYITSSGKQSLVDRAITDKAFGAGRDIGVAIHNKYEKSPGFEYAVGIFNGTGDKPWFQANEAKSKFTNVPDHVEPAVVARMGYNHGGIKGYSEADLEGGGFRFAVAASGAFFLDTAEDNDARRVLEVDCITKLHGFTSSGAVYAHYTEGTMDKWGFHSQLGYVLQKKYQPVVRYAYVAPEGNDNDDHEVALGFAIYYFGHKLKWQTEVAALEHKLPETNDAGETIHGQTRDHRFQTQLQLAF